MLRTAKDCIRIREEKLNMFTKSQEEIKGQMKLIESKVMNANIGHKTKYIDLGNIGKLFSENEKQIIKDGYYITQDDKNGTRLYFDAKDYEEYINGYKKLSLKKDSEAQVKEDKKIEINKNNTDDNFKLIFSTFDGKDHHEKEYNSLEEFKRDLESIPGFLRFLNSTQYVDFEK